MGDRVGRVTAQRELAITQYETGALRPGPVLRSGSLSGELFYRFESQHNYGLVEGDDGQIYEYRAAGTSYEVRRLQPAARMAGPDRHGTGEQPPARPPRADQPQQAGVGRLRPTTPERRQALNAVQSGRAVLRPADEAADVVAVTEGTPFYVLEQLENGAVGLVEDRRGRMFLVRGENGVITDLQRIYPAGQAPPRAGSDVRGVSEGRSDARRGREPRRQERARPEALPPPQPLIEDRESHFIGTQAEIDQNYRELAARAEQSRRQMAAEERARRELYTRMRHGWAREHNRLVTQLNADPEARRERDLAIAHIHDLERLAATTSPEEREDLEARMDRRVRLERRFTRRVREIVMWREVDLFGPEEALRRAQAREESRRRHRQTGSVEFDQADARERAFETGDIMTSGTFAGLGGLAGAIQQHASGQQYDPQDQSMRYGAELGEVFDGLVPAGADMVEGAVQGRRLRAQQAREEGLIPMGERAGTVQFEEAPQPPPRQRAVRMPDGSIRLEPIPEALAPVRPRTAPAEPVPRRAPPEPELPLPALRRPPEPQRPRAPGPNPHEDDEARSRPARPARPAEPPRPASLSRAGSEGQEEAHAGRSSERPQHAGESPQSRGVADRLGSARAPRPQQPHQPSAPPPDPLARELERRADECVLAANEAAAQRRASGEARPQMRDRTLMNFAYRALDTVIARLPTAPPEVRRILRSLSREQLFDVLSVLRSQARSARAGRPDGAINNVQGRLAEHVFGNEVHDLVDHRARLMARSVRGVVGAVQFAARAWTMGPRGRIEITDGVYFVEVQRPAGADGSPARRGIVILCTRQVKSVSNIRHLFFSYRRRGQTRPAQVRRDMQRFATQALIIESSGVSTAADPLAREGTLGQRWEPDQVEIDEHFAVFAGVPQEGAEGAMREMRREGVRQLRADGITVVATAHQLRNEQVRRVASFLVRAIPLHSRQAPADRVRVAEQRTGPAPLAQVPAQAPAPRLTGVRVEPEAPRAEPEAEEVEVGQPPSRAQRREVR